MGRKRILWTIGFWAVVALVAGTAQYLSFRVNSPGVSWFDGAGGPILASAVWIPMTLAIMAAAERWPPVRFTPTRVTSARVVVLHLLASAAVSFVLNGVFVLRALPLSGAMESWTSLSLAYVHINAAAYWAIALGTIAVQRLTTRASEVVVGPKASVTLTVRSGNANVVVRVEDIRWIEGAGDYVRIHTAESEHLHSERLKQLESMLDGSRFVRVHRSAIVNVDAVEKLTHVGHGDYEAKLDTGATVRVTRTRRERLNEVLRSRELTSTEGDQG